MKNLKIGTYNITISSNVDINYENTTLTQSITVKKIPVKIIGKNKKFKVKKKNKKYTILIKDNKNNPITNVKVTLKVNGKKYTVKSNKKGKVMFKIKLNKKRKYSTVVIFKGDDIYTDACKKNKIIVK